MVFPKQYSRELLLLIACDRSPSVSPRPSRARNLRDMHITTFFKLNPGDRFVDQDDRVYTKINGVTARLYLENPSDNYGLCLAAMGPQVVVRFLPVVPAKFIDLRKTT